MGIKNKGCGCLTLIVAMPAALFALSFLRSCVSSALAPSTSYYEDIPGATDKFVKEQLSGYRSASTDSKKATPTGSFTVDIKSKSGKDRRFQFSIKGRDDSGNIKMGVTEIGDGNSNFGGPVKFNVVFWNPLNLDKTGLHFQLNFSPEGGCSVSMPNTHNKTIYIANKERTCAKRFTNGEIYFANAGVALGKEKNINSTMLTLPESFTQVSAGAIKTHQKYNSPFEPEKQQYKPKTDYSR